MSMIPSEQELRDLLKEGKTLYQISRQFNTKIPEIFELCKDYDLLYPYQIPKPTKQDLESMYHGEGMAQWQIGKEFGVTQPSVHIWFRNHNIQVTVSKIPSKEVLEKMYYEYGMTQEQIGKEFDVHQITVSGWFRKYNIQAKVPMPPIDELQRHIDEGLNQHQIAEKYNVHDVTIFRWCEYYGIPGMVNSYRCTTPEHQEWRDAVFDRDHRTCQKCGATNTPMQAHHIVPYCDHPEVAYELENGITLCKNCHESIRQHEYEYLDQFAAITQRP